MSWPLLDSFKNGGRVGMASQKQPSRLRSSLWRVLSVHTLTLVDSATPLLERALACWTVGTPTILLKTWESVRTFYNYRSAVCKIWPCFITSATTGNFKVAGRHAHEKQNTRKRSMFSIHVRRALSLNAVTIDLRERGHSSGKALGPLRYFTSDAETHATGSNIQRGLASIHAICC